MLRSTYSKISLELAHLNFELSFWMAPVQSYTQLQYACPKLGCNRWFKNQLGLMQHLHVKHSHPPSPPIFNSPFSEHPAHSSPPRSLSSKGIVFFTMPELWCGVFRPWKYSLVELLPTLNRLVMYMILFHHINFSQGICATRMEYFYLPGPLQIH